MLRNAITVSPFFIVIKKKKINYDNDHFKYLDVGNILGRESRACVYIMSERIPGTLSVDFNFIRCLKSLLCVKVLPMGKE